MEKTVNFLVSAYDTPYQDSDDEMLKEIFSVENIIDLIQLARQYNMKCLSNISLESKTFFNQKQVFEITRNELPILRTNEKLSKKLLDTLERISSLVFEGYQFLKFEPSTKD